MKVLGGVGSKHGHRPVHVADIRPGGVVDQCCHIQVRPWVGQQCVTYINNLI